MADDLFSDSLESRFDEFAPLAARMRPHSLDEFVGQEHLLGPGSPLRTLIERNALTSLILWGPPGTGKTSLANIVAAATNARYEELSAVNATVADVRRTINQARDVLAGTGRKTILFIDEIHRFNKGQQDALLPSVENRWITLIGATTENPYFELISALLSRCLLVRLESLSPEQIATILRRALTDSEHGLGKSGVQVDEAALEHIVNTAGGDARSALNALEVCVVSAQAEQTDRVSLAMAEQALQRRQVRYDKQGDQHFDVVSAFIKSMRGSDPDASLFWLARMLEAGEDPRFIARRIVILASEDIGNADPMALVVAVAAAHALEHVGLPEAALNLSQAVTYMAAAPKSNAATVALGRATDDVKESANIQVPVHLRAHFSRKGAKGERPGYKYPHDYPGGWVDQSYLPEGVKPKRYYEPTKHGKEAEIGARLEELRRRRRSP
ncbi:MAG TPA: replication-associated recombination protein A [Actinomycetota bacterium]|nr:replication-associated recombination protein A [Actinomycetota bacterium]